MNDASRSRRDSAADQQFWHLCRQGRRPQLRAFLADWPAQSSAQVAAVIVLDQRERWLAGDRVAAEEYLALLPADAEVDQARCDVVYGELLAREELGEAPPLEEYCRRFPDLAAALTRQVELHQALGDLSVPGPTLPGEPPGPPSTVPCVPGYELLEEIGRGGMGAVYKARQLSLDRVVALKLVRAPASEGEQALARLRREAQVLARLSHPNVVTVHDAGAVDESLYLTMELVEGEDLHRLVRRTGPLAVPLARELLRQAALGLGHAHEAGLVHRDIKPSNLIVGQARDGGPVLKVLDLGLARVVKGTAAPTAGGGTQLGTFLGTPDFVAPEQAADPRAADARSDLYSLGCTFFFALTGQPPFSGATPMAKVMQHHVAPAPSLADLRPDAPAELVSLMARLLAKRPEDRFQTAAELADALAQMPPPRERRAASPRAPAPRWAPGARLAGHTDWVKGVAFVADSRHVASVSLDRTVRLWESATGREAWRGEGHTAGVLCLAAAPRDRGLVSGGEDRTVLGWAPDRQGPIWRGQGHAHNLNAIAFTDDARIVTASHDGTLGVWSANTGELLRQWPAHEGAVWAVAPVPGGQFVLSAGQDRVVRRWSVARGEAAGALPEQAAPVTSVAVTPDGRIALTGGADGVVRAWDLKARTEARAYEGHTGRVTALAVAPEGQWAVSASRDQTLRVWALSTGECQVLGGHAHWVTAVAWSPDGAWLASGSSDRAVCLWERQS